MMGSALHCGKSMNNKALSRWTCSDIVASFEIDETEKKQKRNKTENEENTEKKETRKSNQKKQEIWWALSNRERGQPGNWQPGLILDILMISSTNLKYKYVPDQEV